MIGGREGGGVEGREGREEQRGLSGRQQPDLEVPVCHAELWSLPWGAIEVFEAREYCNLICVFKTIISVQCGKRTGVRVEQRAVRLFVSHWGHGGGSVRPQDGGN